jgi:hypothetical protein
MLRFQYSPDQAPTDPKGRPMAARGERDERSEQRRPLAHRNDETHYIHPTWIALAEGRRLRPK